VSHLRAFALDFHRAAGYAMPTDRALHQLAVEFAQKHLAEIPDYSSFTRVWVAAEVGADEKPIAIEGALGFTMRPDFTMARFLNKQALVTLYHRANAHLADNGCRGSEGLVYVSSTEDPEQRCPQQAESLAALGAVPAERFLIKIR
jgi:hypothetical protein